MFSKEDKILILNSIKQHYNLKNNVEFAAHLGISPQNLSNWYSRGTLDFELIYTKCLDINGNWLLSGKGEMLLSEATPAGTAPATTACKACKEKDERIMELKDHIATLKDKISSLQKASGASNSNYSQTV